MTHADLMANFSYLKTPNRDYISILNDMRTKALAPYDEISLDIYTELWSATSKYNYQIYSKIFEICLYLNVENIFDIGCGPKKQAYMLAETPNIKYTGIDPTLFQTWTSQIGGPSYDVGYVNELMASVLEDKIKYIKEKYPCDLNVPKNNIALGYDALGRIRLDTERNNQYIDSMGRALSADFERVILHIYKGELGAFPTSRTRPTYCEKLQAMKRELYADIIEKWKSAMPQFHFCKISDDGFIFGSKFSEDIEKLEKVYPKMDDYIFTGLEERKWAWV